MSQEQLRHALQRIVDCDDAGLAITQDLIDEAKTALATEASVSDEQIAACVKRASTYGLPFVGLLNPGGTPSDFSKRFTAEILALRPAQPAASEGSLDLLREFDEAMSDAGDWPDTTDERERLKRLVDKVRFFLEPGTEGTATHKEGGAA